MEQSSITPPPVGGEPPKKKKGGCLKIGLIVLGVFLLIGIIGARFGDDNAQPRADATEETAEVVEEVKPAVDSVLVAQLKPNFTEKEDDFKGIIWIEPKSAPKYNSQNGIYTYFDLKEGKPENLRLKIQYAANDWLFIKSYTFLIDGKTYEFSSPEVERDNDSRVWEWSDTGVAENYELLTILAAMEKAKEVKIRFNGEQYQNDRTLTNKDINLVLEPIRYYKALGGKLN